MYARVARFSDVPPERMAELEERIEGEEGPPPGIPAKSLRIIYDADQSTAVAISFFDSEEDMREADETLNAMDTGETPGSRASVDKGEVKVEVEA